MPALLVPSVSRVSFHLSPVHAVESVSEGSALMSSEGSDEMLSLALDAENNRYKNSLTPLSSCRPIYSVYQVTMKCAKPTALVALHFLAAVLSVRVYAHPTSQDLGVRIITLAPWGRYIYVAHMHGPPE